MNFIEVALETGIDSGELLSMLENGETLGAWEAEGVLRLYWSEEKWNPATLLDLKSALARLGIKAQSILAIRSIPDQDWNTKWAESLNPILLGQHIRIRQSWHPADAAFDGIELVLDPKRAFGSGYHATTQLVIEWLENHIRGQERILDVGTGSAILAMAAIRLGAASALAIDNDPVALECAREYCDANGLGPELELRVCSFEDLDTGEFDVILANLDIRTLPLFCWRMPKLLKAGGIACLSGLQRQDFAEISEALSHAGLRINSKAEREEWLCLDIVDAKRSPATQIQPSIFS
jgi:ribosomal protein L11 methyltransferase